MATLGSKSAALLFGKTVKISRIGVKQIPCVQVRCQENKYNDYIKMYFANSTDYWALDKVGDVQLGDTVLIQPVESSDRIASTVTHKINKVISRFGTKIDPVTKKQFISFGFADQQEIRRQMIDKRTGSVRDE